MNIILKGKNNNHHEQRSIQGGNMMNLINMINVNNDYNKRKASKVSENVIGKRESGYSIYESLEYVKNNLGKSSFNLQMEMMKSFIR
ncbi:MAG TPA: hypothetical protein VEF53_01450 [Patescibacteria group bacterium]|nr:hypothetical protein [Patescibacteria group bacterium]